MPRLKSRALCLALLSIPGFVRAQTASPKSPVQVLARPFAVLPIGPISPPRVDFRGLSAAPQPFLSAAALAGGAPAPLPAEAALSAAAVFSIAPSPAQSLLAPAPWGPREGAFELGAAGALAAESPAEGSLSRTPVREALKHGLGNLGFGRLYDGSKLAASDRPSLVDSAVAPAAPVVAERGAFELQKDVDRLYARLAQIHDLEQRGLPAGDSAELNRMKLDFLRQMDALFAAVPVPAGEGADFGSLSARLRELRARRAELLKSIQEDLRQTRWRELELSNRAAIALNDRILKAQLQAARMMLVGQSSLRPKALRRNAALWALAGALNSAAAQQAELRYQANLRHAAQVFAVPSGEVSITQSRWISVLRALDAAGRDLRNKREEQAQARIDLLGRVYASRTSRDAGRVLLSRYAALAGELRRLSSRIARLRGSPAPADPAQEIAAISQDIAGLKARVPHPKISVSAGILYKDADAARRGQDHILDSIREEHALLLRHIANLEYGLDLLAAVLGGSDAKARVLSGEELQRVLGDLEVLREWTDRGSVWPKQLGAQYLETAAESLKRRDWRLAWSYLDRTLGAFRTRLSHLENISARVRRRAGTLP